MSLKSKYNPFRVPSSTATAEQHRAATSAGIPTTNEQRCACCLFPIQQTPLPINFSMFELLHLGYQYKQLYDLSFMICIILVLVFFDSGISQLHDTLKIQGQYGINRDWSTLSPNYPAHKFWLYSTLSFVSLTFFIFIVRLFQTYRQNTWSQQRNGQQQWSILLKNVPKSINALQKIRDLFKSNFDHVEIKQIILLPLMDKYTQAKQQINKEVASWKILLLNQDKKKQQIIQMLKKIQESTAKFNQLKQQLSLKKNQNFCGNALVVFQRKSTQKEVLKAWKSKFFTKNKLQASFGSITQGDKGNIFAEKAPSPSEIQWQNICLPNSQYRAKARLSYILVILLQIGFFVFYFVSQLCIGRKIGIKFPNCFGSICSLILLSILSLTLLPFAIQLISKRERQPTMTQYYQSSLHKLAVSLIVIKCVVVLAVESVFNPGPQSARLTINKMVILSFSDLAVSILFWLINPKDIINRILRMRNKKNKLTQEQANNLYLKPSHQISLKFSFLLNCFWAATMFSNLAPIVIILQIGCVFGFFWIDKINLSRRSSVSFKRISTNIFVYQIIAFMEWSLILKPLANLFFWSTANQTPAIQQIVMLVFGIAYNLVPKQIVTIKIFNLLKINMKQCPDDIYTDSKMDTLYSIQNPITGGLQAKLNFIAAYKGQKVQINNQVSQITHSFEAGSVQKSIQQRRNQQKVENIDKVLQEQQKQMEDKIVQQTERNMFSQ